MIAYANGFIKAPESLSIGILRLNTEKMIGVVLYNYY